MNKNELDPHQKETLIGSTLPLAATPHVHLTTIEFLDGRAVQPLLGTRASVASAQAASRSHDAGAELLDAGRRVPRTQSELLDGAGTTGCSEEQRNRWGHVVAIVLITLAHGLPTTSDVTYCQSPLTLLGSYQLTISCSSSSVIVLTFPFLSFSFLTSIWSGHCSRFL